MWKALLVRMVTEVVQVKMLEYVNSIQDVTRQAEAIQFMKSIRQYMLNSRSSLTRAIARFFPFEVNP